MSEPTTIHWLTLPRNGNGGAALVTWRATTHDTTKHHGSLGYGVAKRESISYLLGVARPRYPVPALRGWNKAGKINGKDNSGGVADDCIRVGATFVDFSRGYLEWY